MKTAEGIPLGTAAPHAVQPLPDRPRLGHSISEADLAAWNIDIRTPDGLGLPPGRGSVAEGKAVYAAKCVACHGADAKGGPCTARWSAESAA
jgi:S-disulfanyl-L-cysteine oxidoreductase SoxD